MRKFLFFLCALLTGVSTMWADEPEVTGKSFTLTCDRGSVYWDGTTMVGSRTSKTKFAIVEYENETYLYDVDNQAFVVHTADSYKAQGGTGNPCEESTTDFSKIVKGLSWGNTYIEAYPYYLADENGNWLNMDGTPRVYMNTWKEFEEGKGGNTYKVEDIENFDSTDAVAILESYFNPSATVQYVITDQSGKQVFASEALPAQVGTTITALPEAYQRPYCTYSVNSTFIAQGSNTVNVTVTYDLPFVVSDSYTGAKWYTMYLRNDKYVFMGESEPYYPATATVQTKRTNEAYHWAFSGNPYEGIVVYNKQAGDGYTLAKDGDNVVMRQQSYSWTIGQNGDGFTLKETGTANNYINQSGGASGPLQFWNSAYGATDPGSTFHIEEVEEMFDVTYSIYNGNDLITSTVVKHVAGEPAVLPEEYNADFATYTYSVDQITASTREVRVDVTFTTPFTLSETVENAEWYFMTLRDHYVYYDEESGEIRTNQTAYDTSDAYQWAFLGNPVTGIKVLSRKAGTYFDNAQEKVELSSIAYEWRIRSLDSDSEKFGLYNGSKYINEQNHTNHNLIYYGVFETDPGSQFKAVPLSTIYYELIGNLEAIKDKFGDSLGKYHLSGNESGKNIDELLSELKSNYNTENYNRLVALFENIEINQPTSGTFLRITGTTSNMHLAGGTATHDNGPTVYAMTDAEDATTIFYYDGTYLTNLGTGKTNNMSSASWDWVYGNTNGAAVQFGDGGTNGGYYIQSGDRYFYDNGDNENNGYADRGSARNDARYNSWSLEEVTTLPITLNDIEYATLCSPVALTIPSGVTAYVATGIEVTTINLAPITSTIPANVPVILEGTADATYNFSIATGGSNPDTNILTATGLGVASIEARSVYTLQNIDERPGFYTYTETQLPAFKAYLPAETVPNRVKGFTFDFGTTDGIATVEGAVAEGSVIYNLAGQRVEKAVKGVYIVNGKKVLVK